MQVPREIWCSRVGTECCVLVATTGAVPQLLYVVFKLPHETYRLNSEEDLWSRVHDASFRILVVPKLCDISSIFPRFQRVNYWPFLKSVQIYRPYHLDTTTSWIVQGLHEKHVLPGSIWILHYSICKTECNGTPEDLHFFLLAWFY
jgi:hypothetical protein